MADSNVRQRGPAEARLQTLYESRLRKNAKQSTVWRRWLRACVESEISGRLKIAVVVVKLGMAFRSAIAEASEVFFPGEFNIADGTVTLLGND